MGDVDVPLLFHADRAKSGLGNSMRDLQTHFLRHRFFVPMFVTNRVKEYNTTHGTERR